MRYEFGKPEVRGKIAELKAKDKDDWARDCLRHYLQEWCAKNTVQELVGVKWSTGDITREVHAILQRYAGPWQM